MNLHTKVKLNILIANLVGLIGAALFFSWSGIMVAFVSWIIYNIGVSGGFHRLFAHKQYKVGQKTTWALLLAGTLAGIGSCVSWAGQHRLHHRSSDIEGKDPYYPHNGRLKAWIFGPWNVAMSPMSIKDLIRDPVQMFFHNHYFKVQMAWVALLFIINPLLVIWMWALPSAGTFFSLQVVGVWGHSIGKQDYYTNDNSLNSHFLNVFTLGESYQNTHHHNASALILGKYDIMGKFLDRIRIK